MEQRWHDLLFAHWPVPAAVLHEHLPPALEVDTFDGSAWIGVVPFRMSGIRLRGLPPIPGTSAFPELNVRTYVRLRDRPGVWFFSLDAGNRLAVRVARAWFHLPYFDARMTCAGDEIIRYESARTHRGAPPAALRASYRPTGPPHSAEAGSLEAFLTERYCLYAADRRGRLFRGEIHHRPWSLQPAEAELELDTMTTWLAIGRPGEPLLHFARQLIMVAWAPVPVNGQR